jgi:flavin-dependent dehydrogenase
LRAGDAVLAHMCAHVPALDEALRPVRATADWLAAGPIAPGIRVGDASPGVFRIGNCAGEAHPIIAEGISMAIASAFLLCHRLVALGGAPAPERMRALGALHARDWRRAFAPRLRFAAALAALAMHGGSRSMIEGTARLFPALLTLGAAWSGKATAAAGAAKS